MSEFSLLPNKLLTDVYGDLARPGVSQVGKTIGNILWLCMGVINGPIELVRLRCKNRMEKYAENLSKIDERKLIEVIPEVGVPIINALTYTQIDELKSMYISILTNASSIETIELVHPGFISIIQNLTKDDIVILDYLKTNKYIPKLMIRGHRNDSNGFNDFGPFTHILHLLSVPSNQNLYFNNLYGLGLINDETTCRLSEDRYYAPILCNKDFLSATKNFEGSGIYTRIENREGYYELTDYGKKFLNAVS